MRDAVVTIHPESGTPSGAIRFPWRYQVAQRGMQFVPNTLIVPVGATVSFPNQDRVRHHVYSFSRAARFELRLYGRDETRSYRFTTEGSVAIGCNIHDQMQGFIKVVDTPFAGKTASNGRVTIEDVPAGGVRVTVWHPRVRGEENERHYNVTVPASGTLARRVTMPTRG